MNVDASRFLGRSEVGTAGVIQDYQGADHGAVLKHYLGNISSEAAELMAIHDGIRFALALGYRTFIIESDPVNVVNSIKNKCILSSEVLLS